MLRKWHRRLLIGCILVSCLVGAWLSSQLVAMHDGGPNSDSGDSGFLARLCGSGSGTESGCKSTSRSVWSQVNLPIPVPGGGFSVSLRSVPVPVAFLGLAYFVSLGTWFAMIGGPRPVGAFWHRLVQAIAVCGLGASAFFVSLMAFGGATWCMGCVAVHTINLIMVAAIWILCVVPSEEIVSHASAQPTRATLSGREAMVALVGALLFVVGLFSYGQESLMHRYDVMRLEPYKEMVLSLQHDPALLINAYLAQPRHRIEFRPDEVDSKSHHQLVVFTDFECDSCYLNSQVIRDEVMKVFGENLAVCIRHFPLCAHCNKGIKETLHPGACRAAYAAESARHLRGDLAFKFVHGLLFANRKQLSDPVYRYVAGQIGIEPDRFLVQMEDPVIHQVVQDDIALGRGLGVNGTPTMFLDGRRIPPLCLTLEFWQAAAKLPDSPLVRRD
jgi:predicted DsbA family dithiol-disulfide isomerase